MEHSPDLSLHDFLMLGRLSTYLPLYALSSLANLTMLPRHVRQENLDPIVPKNFPNSFQASREESICLSSTDSESN